MKGYELSNDYNQLWALIQEGYRVPAWGLEDYLYEVTCRNSEYWQIISGDQIMCNGLYKEKFLHDCQQLNFQFIVPNKQ